MKRTLALIAALLMLFAVTVSADSLRYKTEDFSIDFPASFTVLDQTNLKEHEDFIAAIDGNSPSSFLRHMKDTSMLVYAAPADNAVQMQLFSWQDSISETIGTLKALDDELFQTAATAIQSRIESTAGTKITAIESVSMGDVDYLKYTITVTEGKQTYGSVQYLTIVGDVFYSLAFYNDSGAITADQMQMADSIFETLDIAVEHPTNWTYYLLRIGGIVILLIAVAVVVLLLLSIVRDLRTPDNREDRIPDRIKINRNRKK